MIVMIVFSALNFRSYKVVLQEVLIADTLNHNTQGPTVSRCV